MSDQKSLLLVRSDDASKFKTEVVGTGTAGAPAAGVVTVQGITGGEALPISGGGTAGTPDTGVVTVQGIAGADPVITEGAGTAGTPAGGVMTVQGVAGADPVITEGAGTAGTPAGGVVTVQGDAAGEPLRVTIVAGGATDDPDVNGVPGGTVSISDYGSVSALAIDTATVAGIAEATVTATKTGYVRKVRVSSSGLAKFEILVGATYGAAVPVAPPIFTNPARPSVEWTFDVPLVVAAEDGIFIKGTNRDNAAQDLYAQIDAYETV